MPEKQGSLAQGTKDSTDKLKAKVSEGEEKLRTKRTRRGNSDG